MLTSLNITMKAELRKILTMWHFYVMLFILFGWGLLNWVPPYSFAGALGILTATLVVVIGNYLIMSLIVRDYFKK